MGFFSRTPKAPLPNVSGPLSQVLRERGYVYQHSAPLEEITDGPKRTLYLGVDPTADSMHVGQLQGILVLRRFLEHGHKLIIVVGAGTGMVGDPGGKSAERNLLSDEVVDGNASALKKQFERLFGGMQFKMVNNADWLRSLNYMEFLRDIGKHFTVNEMIKRDSVRPRLETPDASISYTEFSYMLLQAYDYLHLHGKYSCDLQVGGSDQWGNIVSGVDLIRKKTGDTAYALSWPLLTTRDGKKFGKSEGNAVWLDPKKTTPFQFYQFWINTNDDEAEKYLLKMTLLPKAEIEKTMEEQRQDPATRAAQKKLAFEVTALVHGIGEAEKARDAARALFSGDASAAAANMSAVPGGRLRDIVSDMSVSELRRLVAQGAVSSVTTGAKIENVETEIHGDTIRIGKNRFIKVE
ncbi:MAG TPA: tyrosine--tRNA ligase [Candidatus Paceibacterota bacterium]|nr:tyrosine--tRNA ligase [Candidatus Paceibacterota bacterium]